MSNAQCIPTSCKEASIALNAEVIVDWDGENDPANPSNWAGGRKRSIVAVIAYIAILGPIASTMFAPSVTLLLAEFGAESAELGAFIVSIYLIGAALGPLFLSPLGEHYGRTIMYHASNISFLVSSILCAVSVNLPMFIIFRFIQGVAGGPPMTLGGGTIADLYPPARRGLPMAIWITGFLLGPIIGPLAGGFLAEDAGWRWIFWTVSILTCIAILVSFLVLEETYGPTLLKRKARALQKKSAVSGVAAGNIVIRSKFDNGLGPKRLLLRAIIRPSKMLLRSPIAFIFAIYMGVIYSYLFIMYTTFTPVFTQQYGFTLGTAGLSYLGLGLGFLIGQICSGIFSDRYLRAKAEVVSRAKNESLSSSLSSEGGSRSAGNAGDEGDKLKPEYRLPPLFIGVFFIFIGFVWYGWSVQYRAHWIVPILGTCVIGFGCICSFLSAQMYLVDSFGIYAASALAANTVVRSLFGAVVPLAGSSLYGRLGYGWGNTLLGLVALLFGPLPLLLWRYGERLRTNPRFQPQW